MPRKIALGILAVIAAFAVLLAAAIALVFATLRIERIAGQGTHAAAVSVQLVFGAAALLAAVYIATRVAVRAFASGATPTANDSANPSDFPRA